MRCENNFLYKVIQFDVPKSMFIMNKSGLKNFSGFCPKMENPFQTKKFEYHFQIQQFKLL